MSKETPKPWQNRCLTTVEALQSMCSGEYMADISVGHDRVAHKLILSLWSPVLADILMKKDSKICNISLCDSPEVTDIILRFMYSTDPTNVISPLPLDTLFKVYEVSKVYSLCGLGKACQSRVRKMPIRSSDAIDFFDAGLRMGLQDTIQKCKDVISNEGITVKSLNPSIAPETVFELLKMERIAVDSEGALLRLVISWLNERKNLKYRYKALSMVDFSSIGWGDYQNIIRDYPKFFAESELSKILLSVAQQETDELRAWFNTSTTTVVRRGCSNCSSVCQYFIDVARLKRSDIKFKGCPADGIHTAFTFTVSGSSTIRLVGIELNFGPQDIPEDCFKISVEVTGCDSSQASKPVNVDLVQRGRTFHYMLYLWKPEELKTDHRLSIGFHFTHHKFYVSMAQLVGTGLKWFKCAKNVNPRLKLLSSLLPMYCSNGTEPKLLLSSFRFRICNDHSRYLERKVARPERISCSTQTTEPAAKKFKDCYYEENTIPVIKKELAE